MKKLSSYFREMKANHMPSEKQPTALMAIRQIPGSEEDILAILDTGRNATCYGASWLRKYCVVVGCEPALQPVAGSGMWNERIWWKDEARWIANSWVEF